MDEHKIAFIACVNDDASMEECRHYIDRLDVPEGFSVQILEMRGAASMTSGYNTAMRQSDARYKVYLHQDVYILNRSFITDILHCFLEDPLIGMIGTGGICRLKDANVWSALDVGGCNFAGTYWGQGSTVVRPRLADPVGPFQEVDYIDGMLLVTSQDLEWDEQIDGFHFYDASQCIRFQKAGYKTVVIRQEETWLFHDMGPINLTTYRRDQERFAGLYGLVTGNLDDNPEITKMCSRLALTLTNWFDDGKYELIQNTLAEIGEAIYFHQVLLTMCFVMEAYRLEKLRGEEMLFADLSGVSDWQHISDKWFRLRAAVIRAVFGGEPVEILADLISEHRYAATTLIVAALHNIPTEEMSILESIGTVLGERGKLPIEEWNSLIAVVRDYERVNLPATA